MVTGKKPKQSINTPKRISGRLEEAEIAQARIHDVLLLLENLFKREKTTAKIILNCLYEVGSINLINQKIPFQPLNGLMKAITQMSQPVFGVLALYWFQKNCPQLLTNWLAEQVTFKETGQELATEVQEIREANILAEETLSQEIKSLRTQVRLLTGILVVAIAVSVVMSLT